MTLALVLPHLNAALNATATCFLIAGYVFIRRRDRRAHRICMLTCACVSGVFLVGYVTLRFNAPIFPFGGQGSVRILYYAILVSHVLLAMSLVPLVGITLFRALKERFERHRRLARWTWPIWFYVSVTGIVVYVMLYQLYPAPAGGG